jgi:hypothetical protein
MKNYRPFTFLTKSVLPLVAVLCIFFYDCKGDKKKEKEPNVLENKSIDVSVLSKRSGKDLMENLYDELEERSEELQQLEGEMNALAKTTGDSISLFTRYDNKSNMFYEAAIKHAGNIQDSILRIKMRKIIDSSLLSYKKLVAPDTSFIHRIAQSQSSLKDLHTILKIVKTLPIMEQYQKDYLPADSMLHTLYNRYEALNRKVDSLAGGFR